MSINNKFKTVITALLLFAAILGVMFSVIPWIYRGVKNCKESPLFVEDSSHLITKIFGQPRGSTGNGTLHIKMYTLQAEVSGEFWLIRRTDGAMQPLTFSAGQHERTLTVSEGEYVLVPGGIWGPFDFNDPVQCVTHEGESAYLTHCLWEGTVPTVLTVQEKRVTTTEPLLWLATAEEPKRRCGNTRGCRMGTEICRADTQRCASVCDIHPLTRQPQKPCRENQHCTPYGDGYSVCQDSSEPHRIRLVR